MTICQFKSKKFISLSQKYEERYVNFPSLELHYFKATLCTAWKVSVLWVFLVRIFPHSDWIRRVSLRILSEGEKILTRKTLNMDTFYAVISFDLFRYLWQTSVKIILDCTNVFLGRQSIVSQEKFQHKISCPYIQVGQERGSKIYKFRSSRLEVLHKKSLLWKFWKMFAKTPAVGSFLMKFQDL